MKFYFNNIILIMYETSLIGWSGMQVGIGGKLQVKYLTHFYNNIYIQ